MGPRVYTFSFEISKMIPVPNKLIKIKIVAMINGTAKIRKGTETFMLTENQSIYIPLGEIHALENPGKVPLELIEVQSGSYLGEDDIVRFEDVYGRV